EGLLETLFVRLASVDCTAGLPSCCIRAIGLQGASPAGHGLRSVLSSRDGDSADRCWLARGLGWAVPKPKEAQAVPSGAGDRPGNFRQAAVTGAIVAESVGEHFDLVALALPLTGKPH